ncbi:4-alpha-glucanotransferase [Pendulispora albinea]|uniref:4-alpha-glucanotransferase n=1 Tax=Pendulispora albinea TaxID=2741071 RepID=A0ABZ2MC96_9BACT
MTPLHAGPPGTNLDETRHVPKLSERTSGVLLHPTSLPGPYGSGDLGAAARHFIDFLVAARQRWWQMLPIGPVGYGNSPYSALSAFAGNPFLICLDRLAEEGLIERSSLRDDRPDPSGPATNFPHDRVDYARSAQYRMAHLRAAFAAFSASTRGGGEARDAFEAFCEEERHWLDDFALYAAIKSAHRETSWAVWPAVARLREPVALEALRAELRDEIELHRFLQYRFNRDWRRLRAYAHERGVGLIGDLPIFVSHDSADVWQKRHLFALDENGMPTVVSGVPPDYFSATGQRWGNPLYRWRSRRRDVYDWWTARFKTTLARFDAVRLDHFIGFQRYWEIPATEPTAVRGRWMKGPGAPFFTHVKKKLGELGALPLIAEDLGCATPKVRALRDSFGLPGSRVLQFAFGIDPQASTFLPHVYPRRAVVYTGTHDNDTTVGWFNEAGGGESTRPPEQVEKERRAALGYLGAADGTNIHWDMIRMVQLSVANTAIVPMQDLLGLGSESRMNRPGQATGNWEWRFQKSDLTHELADRLGSLTRTYGRS